MAPERATTPVPSDSRVFRHLASSFTSIEWRNLDIAVWGCCLAPEGEERQRNIGNLVRMSRLGPPYYSTRSLSEMIPAPRSGCMQIFNKLCLITTVWRERIPPLHIFIVADEVNLAITREGEAIDQRLIEVAPVGKLHEDAMRGVEAAALRSTNKVRSTSIAFCASGTCLARNLEARRQRVTSLCLLVRHSCRR